MALLLAAALAVPAALLPLLPESARPWNFAAFGAIAVFTAARGGRLGWLAALGLALGAKLVSDLLNYRAHGFDADYLPMGVVYAGTALYAVAGWAVVRRSDRWGVPAGLAGSVGFFLVTNAAAWWEMALPYDRSALGLLHSYQKGLEFHRGTFAGDLLFTGGLFAVHAGLVRATAPTVATSRS